MRKYYQLLLLLICCFSVVVLLMYKSENNRLKYVLQVVNFFGRKDASELMRLANVTSEDDEYDPGLPQPVWWSIGDAFHLYAAYWNKNELVTGGEAFAIVVGKLNAIINFKCSLLFDSGKVINGRFKFQRMEPDSVEHRNNFTTYWFMCKLTRDFGTPRKVIFMEKNANEAHEVMLRRINANQKQDDVVSTRDHNRLTICVDMVNFNTSSIFSNDKNIMQFFVYHQTIGVRDFFVYNGDAFSEQMHKMLHKTNLNIHYFPFNFPFSAKNASMSIHQILENDCIMRNSQQARYSILLRPNEFVYPLFKFKTEENIFRSLDKYSAEITHFEIPSFGVCLNNMNTKQLMDNNYYDPDIKFPHKLLLQRPHTSLSLSSLTAPEEAGIRKEHQIALSQSKILAHRYIECVHLGWDGLHNWRTSMRKDFLLHFDAMRYEMINIL